MVNRRLKLLTPRNILNLELLYDEVLKIKPDNHEAWGNRGIALRELGQYEAAIVSYDQALKIKPDDHVVWNNRGITLRKLGQYEAAIASYDQALQIKPDYHEAWYNRRAISF
jgi:tetratricopeptide (TPR) repeat protein